MLFFFFQAEDGIRDLTVTGVQTCALPIYRSQVAESVSPQRLSGSESYERLRRAAIVLPVILVFGPDAFEFDRQTGVPVARALCLFDTRKFRHKIAVPRRARQADDGANGQSVGSFFEPP